ncbi:MAG: hypothetical protein AB1521_15675 [Bacteroidota bacterium]
MKKIFLLLFYIFSIAVAQTKFEFNTPVKISANPAKGFYWDYILYIPQSSNNNSSLFAIPNNTGKVNDSILVHEKAAFKTINQAKLVAEKLNSPILVPIFPRPVTNWQIYTHALDRDAMMTEISELKRLDLQLIAMIEDAKEIFNQNELNLDEKILMMGFSASGMFTNRFVLLHPEIVKAAAIGSPGGLPIVPVAKFEGVPLRYPIGIDDVKEISGEPFNLTELRNVDLFFFLGAEDNNDSVIYRDSYEQEDEDLIMNYFGKTLQERWDVCKKIYEKEDLSNSKFVLYEGVGHQINNQIIEDLLKFFGKALQK